MKITSGVYSKPGPLGAGLTQVEAGKVLGITKGAVAQRLGRFESKHPNEWNNIISIRNTVSRQRESLESPISLARDIDETKIVKRF